MQALGRGRIHPLAATICSQGRSCRVEGDRGRYLFEPCIVHGHESKGQRPGECVEEPYPPLILNGAGTPTRGQLDSTDPGPGSRRQQQQNDAAG